MAQVRIRPNGTVETSIGTQDIGSGSRTVTLLVTSMALGYLPLERIEVKIGSSDLPPSGASGGSATTGMVDKEVREAAGRAVARLFEACAGKLGAKPAQLELREGGRIGVQGSPKDLPWEEGTALLTEDAIGQFTVPLEDGKLWFLAGADGQLRQGPRGDYDG